MIIDDPGKMISIEMAKASDVDEMAHFLATGFSTREPPAMAAGFTIEQITSLVRSFGADIAANGLSVVARDVQSNDVLGAILATDFSAPPPKDFEPLIETFEPLLAFLDQLDSQCLASRNIQPGQFLHVFMICTASAHSGRGIASAMLGRCLKSAQVQGYTTAVTEATSALSRRLFDKHGFTQLFFARYEDFEFAGTQPFQSISNHEGCALMESCLSGEP